MKHSWIHLVAALSAFLVLVPPTLAGTADAQMPAPDSGITDALFRDAQPIISVSEVRRGQTGYGLTVFAGNEPERFDVEVIGVIRNMNPDVSFILARLTGKGLEKSGVARGMSGSPVYIDGKLAGAVAFSWPFPNEAVAGITPIEVMRQLSGLPPAPPTVTAPPPVKMAELLAGRLPKDVLERQVEKFQPRSRLVNGATPSLQWAASGFGEMSQGLLRQALGNVAPSGKALPGDLAKDLVPGGAVAAVLVDGDLSMAAYGTVTDRYGDQVLAFGHPFLGFGPIRVPMATAEVVTLFSSQADSFKISNAGQIIGAFEQDRLAGIQGRIGAEAPMVPMVLRVKGERDHVYNLRLADFPEFMPLLVGSSVLAGLEAASYSQGAQGIDLVANLKLRGHGDLEIRQSFDSENAGTEAAVHLLTLVGYLVQNPLEQVSLERVDVQVEQSRKPRAADLVGAHADRTVVRPGERVNLNLDLVPYRGERFRHSLAVDLPEDLPAGRYSLLVGDGASADAARLSLEPAEPVSLHQALEMLRSFHSRRDLVVLGVYAGAGLSVGGEVMPRLPGSVRSIWSAAASGSAVPLRTTIAQRERETLDVPVSGLVRIDLEVRRREPVGGEPAARPAQPGESGGAAETAKAPAAPGQKGRS
jgi:SpoIVB peptidase S55